MRNFQGTMHLFLSRRACVKRNKETFVKIKMYDERDEVDIEYVSILNSDEYSYLSVDEKQLYNQKLAYESYMRYEAMLFPEQNSLNEIKVDIFPINIRRNLNNIRSLTFTFNDEEYFVEFCRLLNRISTVKYIVQDSPFPSRSFFAQVTVRLSYKNSRDELYNIFRNTVPQTFESKVYEEVDLRPRYYSCEIN
jgi:hypothetical protein